VGNGDVAAERDTKRARGSEDAVDDITLSRRKGKTPDTDNELGRSLSS
jgi:hypothetical protein